MSTKYNLNQLLTNFKIEIPAIQRDYAFGRTEAKEKRVAFVKKLLHSIGEKKGLHLDFVYGQQEKGKMILLDGQQRMTTLWLLAIYLVKINRNDAKNETSLDNFTYATRTSTKEFCQSLIKEPWEEKLLTLENESKFIDLFYQQKWFFHSWQFDPTITGMVAMLQTIHERYCLMEKKESEVNLTSLENITFSFLPIENLENSEEMYLKMNARGKALSEWENYKAELFEYTSDERFKKEVDGALVDYFWKVNHDNEPEINTEKTLLKFFKTVLRVEVILGNTSLNYQAIQRFWRFLIDNDEIRFIDFQRFDDVGLRLPDILSSLSNISSTELTWDDLTLFASYYLFAKLRESDLSKEENEEDLKQIVRVASNLIGRNNRSDGTDNTKNIQVLNNILSDQGSVLTSGYLPEEDKESSSLFEIEEWEKLVYETEKHPLSLGTAKWLIEASSSDFSRAKEYLNKAFYSDNSIFTKTNIRSEELIAKLWSYDKNVRNGKRIAQSNNAHSNYYSWWSYFHQSNAGKGIKELIQNNFEYNDLSKLSEDFHNYREWFMSMPSVLQGFHTFQETESRDYVLWGQHGTIQGRKYQLQLMVLDHLMKDAIQLGHTHRNSQQEDFFVEFGSQPKYQVRYENEHFTISTLEKEVIFTDNGNRVTEKLQQTRDKIIELMEEEND